MPSNRSLPPGQIIPELTYPNVSAASLWLCRAFGFSERLRIADHRIQLRYGSGSIVLLNGAATNGSATYSNHGVMVRVENADEHFARAQQAGARIINSPTTYPYGERQYSAEDLAGHRWTFTQTVADVHPSEWGGVFVEEGGTVE